MRMQHDQHPSVAEPLGDRITSRARMWLRDIKRAIPESLGGNIVPERLPASVKDLWEMYTDAGAVITSDAYFLDIEESGHR